MTVRKLVGSLLALLLIPGVGYSLGLGDIHLKSALNQPFNAEIDLLAVTPADADSLEARLAPAEAFQQVGLDYSSVLNQLRFRIETDRDGQHRIAVSSSGPIREPFLDFLLQVNWRSGRLLREYTVLLDPPELLREPPPGIQAPQAASPSVRTAQQEPAASPQAAPVAASAPTGPVGGGDQAVQYGPVQRNDTLWNIASQMRPDPSASVQQVMVALAKANPNAFVNGNVNRLKTGEILRLEDPDQVYELTRRQAIAEIARQTRRWKDFKEQAADDARTRPADARAPSRVSGDEPQQPRLKLLAPKVELDKPQNQSSSPAAQEVSDSTPADQQQRQDAGEKGGTDKDQQLSELRNDLMLALENAEAQRRENEELKQRLADLESQLSNMQRLMELQGQGKPAMAEQGKPQPQETTQPAATQPVEKASPDAVAAAQPENEQQTPVKPVAQAPPVPAKPKVQPKPQPQESLLSSLLGDPLILGVIAVVVLAVAVLGFLIVRRRRSADFHESILNLGQEQGAVSGFGDQSSGVSDFAVSGMGDLGQEEAEVDPLTEADVYMAYGRYQQAEDLLKNAIKGNPGRAELHVKLLELYYLTKNKAAFEANTSKAHSTTEASGPLWEKVLVMGHELLPDNPLFRDLPEGVSAPEGSGEAEVGLGDDVLDIGLDLDALAAEMEPSPEEEEAAGAEGDGDLDIDLGVDFSSLEDEDEASFGPGDADDEVAASEQPAGDETESEEELDFSAIFEEPEEEQEHTPAPSAEVPAQEEEGAAEESDEHLLDFDINFNLPGDEQESAEAEAPVQEDDGNALDFDMSGFSLPEEEESATPAGEPEAELGLGEPAAEETTDGDEFSLDLGDLGGLEDATETTSTASEDDGSLDLADLESKLEQDLGDEEFDLGSLDLGDLDIPGDDGSGVAASGGYDDEKDDLSEGLLEDLDEVDTKLDLARAYMEMGDQDGARAILEDVMGQGNDSQKQQATQMLDEMT